ncbi:MAG: hypothetical protein NC434_04325 [Ruminococcus sp.]|nr:hypothetical protein [Ruminococcus sp.]
MTYKKTWISCLLWAVFTCITGVLLADYTTAVWIQKTDAAVGMGTVALIALVFALAAGGCFLFRELYNRAGKRPKADAGKINTVENLLFIAILAAGALYRIGSCLHCGPDQITGGPYFELAAVTAGRPLGMGILIRNMSDLYTVCLSFAMSFLGNKPIAGVWMQIFLQMLTLCLSFWMLRRLVGRIPAYITMLFLAFAPVYTGQIFLMTPEVLSFFLFLLAAFIIGHYVKNYAEDLYGSHSLILMALICGCIIGILTYLDGLFLTLLILPAGLVGVICIKKGEERSSSGGILPIFLFIFIFSAAALAFLGMLAYEAYAMEVTLETTASAWADAYIHLPVYTPSVTDTLAIECLILLFGAAFLVISFWFGRGVQISSPWIIFMLLFGPPHMISGTSGYRIYSFFIWSVLAGIGLQQCFIPKKKTVYAVQTQAPVQEFVSTPELPEAVEIPETPAKPRFIENPLPLPKKHVKRTMDYPYEVDEAKLEFDIEIAENDDFDV